MLLYLGGTWRVVFTNTTNDRNLNIQFVEVHKTLIYIFHVAIIYVV